MDEGFARGAQMALQQFQVMNAMKGQKQRSAYMQELMRKMQSDREQQVKQQKMWEMFRKKLEPTTEILPGEGYGMPDVSQTTPSPLAQDPMQLAMELMKLPGGIGTGTQLYTAARKEPVEAYKAKTERIKALKPKDVSSIWGWFFQNNPNATEQDIIKFKKGLDKSGAGQRMREIDSLVAGMFKGKGLGNLTPEEHMKLQDELMKRRKYTLLGALLGMGFGEEESEEATLPEIARFMILGKKKELTPEEEAEYQKLAEKMEKM